MAEVSKNPFISNQLSVASADSLGDVSEGLGDGFPKGTVKGEQRKRSAAKETKQQETGCFAACARFVCGSDGG